MNDSRITYGGGGVALSVATVTLTDAQIRSFGTTPAIVIPPTQVLNNAGFPATLPKVIAACGVLNTLPGAYGSSCDLFLAYGSDAGCGYVAQAMGLNGNGGFNKVGITTNPEKRIFSFIVGEATALNDNFLDNALVVTSFASDITGGNPANTLKVIVYYVVVDVN